MCVCYAVMKERSCWGEGDSLFLCHHQLSVLAEEKYLFEFVCFCFYFIYLFSSRRTKSMLNKIACFRLLGAATWQFLFFFVAVFTSAASSRLTAAVVIAATTTIQQNKCNHILWEMMWVVVAKKDCQILENNKQILGVILEIFLKTGK